MGLFSPNHTVYIKKANWQKEAKVQVQLQKTATQVAKSRPPKSQKVVFVRRFGGYSWGELAQVQKRKSKSRNWQTSRLGSTFCQLGGGRSASWILESSRARFLPPRFQTWSWILETFRRACSEQIRTSKGCKNPTPSRKVQNEETCKSPTWISNHAFPISALVRSRQPSPLSTCPGSERWTWPRPLRSWTCCFVDLELARLLELELARLLTWRWRSEKKSSWRLGPSRGQLGAAAEAERRTSAAAPSRYARGGRAPLLGARSRGVRFGTALAGRRGAAAQGSEEPRSIIYAKFRAAVRRKLCPENPGGGARASRARPENRDLGPKTPRKLEFWQGLA